MKSLLKTVSVFLLLLLVHTTAWAQATAQMTGTVRDESGAVLPGVTVTVTQTDTGFSRTVVTEGSGAYIIPNLPLGPYRLEVSLSGFRTYVQTGIVLQVGATPTVNAVLAVGNVEETVAVEAAAPLVDVQSAGISEVVENERIVELPLQGRQVTDLIVLGGAAVNTGQVSGQRSRSDSVAISVAGGLRTGVAYVLDGAMHNDAYDNLNMPFPFPDALQEFRVATSGLSADNGVHSGASVNAVTKSGTNRFSGNAFEFLRDSRFNATDPFAAVGKDGKRVSDGLNRNQFGGTLGGPIVRDRLFFFGAYQGTKIHQVPASFISWVPTDAMLAGDFTGYAAPECNAGRPIALRAPFVNNRIDPALMSKAAIEISKRIPSKATNPCGEILFSVPLDNNDKQYVTRFDYQMGPNHSIFGRYIDTFERRLPTLSRTGNPLAVRREFGANKDARAQSTALGDTLVLGTNMVNSFRVTWNDNAQQPERSARQVLRCAGAGHQAPHLRARDAGAGSHRWFHHLGRQFGDGASGQCRVPGGGRRDTGAWPAPDRVRREHGVLEVRFVGLRAYQRHLQLQRPRRQGAASRTSSPGRPRRWNTARRIRCT